MKKVLVLLTAICLVGVIGALISGCGQQTPSINTVNSQPKGLSIKGTIYTTTLSGTVGGPISGAVVTLSGDRANYTAVTNSQGEYVFSGIPDGTYVVVATAEGHQRLSTTTVTIKPSSDVPADNTITVGDIQLSSQPVILSYSPAPNSVITQSPTFVVTFNEAMDTSTVIPAMAAAGVRTFALSGSTVPLSTSWSSDSKTLTITPEAALISNESYTLSVSSVAMRDASGYSIDTTGEQALATSQTYRVATGGVPGDPSNLTVIVNNKPFTTVEGTGADYLDVYTSANWIDLYCDPPSSGGLVTGYKFYAALDTASAGNYVLIGSTTVNYLSLQISTLITALYNSTVNPVSTMNYPFINKAVYFKVVAYNGDGESAAASSGAVKEVVGPQVDLTAFDGRATQGKAAELLNNNYYLAALTAGTDTKIAYIAFNQPVDAATIIPANFTLSGGATVAAASLLTSSSTNLTASFTGNVYSIVKITSDTDFTGAETLTVGTGVKDLAGNPVSQSVTCNYQVNIP